MERLPRPTIAHPSFLPGGSGTTSCASAFLNSPPATLAKTRPPPTFVMKPRRVISLPLESDMSTHPAISSFVVYEFRLTGASNVLYIPAATSDRWASHRSRSTCPSPRRFFSWSTHRECESRPRGPKPPARIPAEQNKCPPDRPPLVRRASRSPLQSAPER